MSALDLTEAKVFLNIPDDEHDDELQDTLDDAEGILAELVGPLEPVTITNEAHTGPGPIILRRWPVISIDSATDNDLVVTDLTADADTGVVYGPFSCIWHGVKVTYVAGRPALPAWLRRAVLELTQHLWQSQRVPGTSRGFQGFGGGSGDTDAPAGQGYLLPYRVQSLIEPHLLPVVA